MTGNNMSAEDSVLHKEISIIVNAQPKTVPSPTVSYDEVVTLAYPTPPAPNMGFNVMYRNAVAPNHEGSLVEGQSVTVRERGTIFNVSPTNKA